MTKLVTTVFGIGLLPGAPGTWGSMAALPLAYGLHYLGSFPLLAVATLMVFIIGLWAATIETKGREDHDPAEIVVDEIVGQWIALFPLSAGLWLGNAEPSIFPYPGWIVAFLGFRFFDIVKPWPVSWADNKLSPMGLMLDDVIAGLLAAIFGIVLAAMVQTWL